MKKLIVLIIILLIGISNIYSNRNEKSKSTNEHKLEWLSFNEGLTKAKAEKKNMLVDSSKFYFLESFHIGKINKIDCIITDSVLPESLQTKITSQGVKLLI